MTTTVSGGSGGSIAGLTSDNADGIKVAGREHSGLGVAMLYLGNGLVVPSAGTVTPIPNNGAYLSTPDVTAPLANQSASTVNTPGWYRATVIALIQSAGEVGAVYSITDGPASSSDVAFNLQASVTAGAHPGTTTLMAIGWYLFDQFGNIFQPAVRQSNGTVNQTFNIYVMLEFMSTA